MSDFHRPNKFSGSRPSGGFNRGGSGRPSFNKHSGGDRERSQSFPAVCSNCQKECTVPFHPNGSKPVYCKDCFGAMRDEQPARRSDSESYHSQPRSFTPAPIKAMSDPRIESIQRQLDGMNKKIDQMLQLLTNVPLPKQAVKPEMNKEIQELSFDEAPAKKTPSPLPSSVKSKPIAKKKTASKKK